VATIRPFKNSDLPGLFSVWMGHWEAARENPPVSVSILERAVLSRSFFRPESLLVAEDAGRVVAWCQHFQDDMPCNQTAEASAETSQSTSSAENASTNAIIAALCFDADRGLEACDQLLAQTEQRLLADGTRQVRVG